MSGLRPDAQSKGGGIRCAQCGSARPATAAGESFLAAHVCPSCGLPWPLDRGREDFFTAFGVPRRLSQDRALLEKRFYAISKALHPDRFAQAGEAGRRASLDRMSFVNEAYRTLRDPALLRQHMLERFLPAPAAPSGPARPPAGARAQVPAELAESWFELQDLLMEDPERAKARLGDFERELEAMQRLAEERISAAEKELDHELANLDLEPGEGLLEVQQTEVPKKLEAFSKLLQDQAYLRSMERDVARLRGRFSGGV